MATIRTDVVRMYRDIHGWVGIISGLALFIAFYAGSITMFEVPLQRWASPPAVLAEPPPLKRTQKLVDKVLTAYPEAAKHYQIVLEPGPEQPARLNWATRGPGSDEHDTPAMHYASLAPDGTLQVVQEGPSQVAQFIDVLHQQVGLPFDHEIAMPVMGAIALLYSIALVSGIIVLLPTLVKDLFALRFGANLKRMWLDVHNVLGLFSLPFHIIMALTSVTFAFHDQFYGVQGMVLNHGKKAEVVQQTENPSGLSTSRPLSPMQIVNHLAEQAPGFHPKILNYLRNRDGKLELRVEGEDPRHGLRGPTQGFAGVEPYTGRIVFTGYLPGHQDGWFATITSFFALHFGNFGGNPVRWGYFFLGLAGAFLFYSGNLLWIETRRRKRRGAGEMGQSHSTRVMGALTIGVSLGCIAGISVTIAAAKILPEFVADIAVWHKILYYVVFIAAVVWAFIRGAARGAVDLLYGAAFVTLMIPAVSILSVLVPGLGWNNDGGFIIDIVAFIAAIVLVLLAGRTTKRIKNAPIESIWFTGGYAMT